MFEEVGPRSCLPNSLRARLQVIGDAQAAGKSAAEVDAIVQDMEQMQMKELAAETDLSNDEKDAVRLLRDFDASIETGFQIAANHGPLCAEPVVGMAYILESVKVNRVEGDEESGGSSYSRQEPFVTDPLISVRSRLPQVTGSLITAVRDACRNGLLDWSPRLMLAMYTCDIQASSGCKHMRVFRSVCMLTQLRSRRAGQSVRRGRSETRQDHRGGNEGGHLVLPDHGQAARCRILWLCGWSVPPALSIREQI